MAKWYVFDLSFFIPDSNGKTKNIFQKNEKTYEKFNKIFKKKFAAHLQKKIFTRAGRQKQTILLFWPYVLCGTSPDDASLRPSLIKHIYP